jgi:hypothetical protein
LDQGYEQAEALQEQQPQVKMESETAPTDKNTETTSNADAKTETQTNTQSTTTTTKEPEPKVQEPAKEESSGVKAIKGTKSAKESAVKPSKSVPKVTEEKPADGDEENLFFDEATDKPDGKVSNNIDVITLVVALAVGIFLMFIVSIREIFHKYFNPILLQRINSVARDVMMLIVIVTILSYVQFLGVDFFQIHVNAICLCLSIFGLCWLLLSIVLVIAGQSFSVNWEERETRVKFRGSFPPLNY